jgi:Tfp pilus assembly protein PilV
MKCETTNIILTGVLGILAALCVFFALRTINFTREFRSLQIQAMQSQNGLMRIQALVNDAEAYGQKAPTAELTRILQIAKGKPAAAK